MSVAKEGGGGTVGVVQKPFITDINNSEDRDWLKTLLQQAYQSLYFMMILFINSKELLENLILVINSKR